MDLIFEYSGICGDPYGSLEFFFQNLKFESRSFRVAAVGKRRQWVSIFHISLDTVTILSCYN